VFAVVVIRAEIDRVFIDVLEKRAGNSRQSRFRIPHGRWRIAVNRTEVPLSIDKGVAHRKRLRHTHQRVVNRGVAVRVVLTQHFADDLGALARRAVVVQPHLVEAVQDPAMHWLQTVPHIGKGASHDHAHGVIEIRALHLVFDVDGDQARVIARREQTSRRNFLVCQK